MKLERGFRDARAVHLYARVAGAWPTYSAQKLVTQPRKPPCGAYPGRNNRVMHLTREKSYVRRREVVLG